MSWEKIDGVLRQLAVGRNNNAWGVNFKGEIFQYTGKTRRRLDFYAMNVGVGVDGTVWAITRSEEIFSWNGIGWTKVPGSLVQISVGDSSHIWGVDRSDNVFYRSGGVLDGTWVQVPGQKLINVSAASDGTVWGVDRNRNIFKWNGKDWDLIGGKLKQIYTSSASLVVGVNSGNEVLQYIGDTWVTYKDVSLDYVAVSIENNVWGIDATEAAYFFQRNLTSTDLPPLTPLTSLTSASSSSPTSSTTSLATNINQGYPTGMIIGLSVGFGLLAIIIIGVAILFIIRHYKKSKLPKYLNFRDGEEQLSEVVSKQNDFRNGEQLSEVVSKLRN